CIGSLPQGDQQLSAESGDDFLGLSCCPSSKLLGSERRISEQAPKALQTCHKTLIPNLQTRPPAELAASKST
ncbi:MAG: hypothetical protein AAFO67_06920, partial [Planctomycetota bacterium]